HARGAVPYRESLAEQRRADILLLLLWNDPREVGVYTGKLFDYVGAGRPILAIGTEHGVAAELIRLRGLGVAAADPLAIAIALRQWIDEKREAGQVAALPESTKAGLSRDEQFARVDDLLHDLRSRAAPRAAWPSTAAIDSRGGGPLD
ncbi:MAG TPA: hypothetical protein VFG00_11920, partial [Acidothermaceae bacterium]|nr:hypothetical protein [Acidothermaceae bacterium]